MIKLNNNVTKLFILLVISKLLIAVEYFVLKSFVSFNDTIMNKLAFGR
jgi:hypothetical protein